MPVAARGRKPNPAVQKLGLSAARFGTDCKEPNGRARLSEAEAMASVALATEAGLRLIDVSPQDGDAETVLGRVLPEAPANSPPFRLVTKTVSIEHGPQLMEAAARLSLQRMRVERGQAIMVQTASDLLGAQGAALWDRLCRLKEEGLYQSIGICATVEDDPVGLARRFKPDVMQLPVSVLDQRLVADGSLSTLAEMGIQIHLRSVLQQGLLFLPRASLPAHMAHAGPRLSRIRRTIAEAGADPLQAALAFALSRPEASAVIVGVASLAELRATLAAAGAPAPSLDWDALKLDAADAGAARAGGLEAAA